MKKKREYAKINIDISMDEDWKSLHFTSQWLYKELLVNPYLSQVGVADWRPKKLARVTHGLSLQKIQEAAEELQEKRFILVDDESEEVLIRTFLKHDGVLKNPNLGAGIKTAYSDVASPDIQKVIVHELKRQFEKNPELPVFKSGYSAHHMAELLEMSSAPIEDFMNAVCNDVPNAVADTVPEPLPTPFDLRSDAAHNAVGNDVPNAVPKSFKNSRQLHKTKDYIPLSKEREYEREDSQQTVDEKFEEWWTHYPKKVDRGQALKTFKAKIKKVDLETLITAADQYAEKINRDGTDSRYIKYPSTWLNAEPWHDEQPEESQSEQSQPEPQFDIDGRASDSYRWYEDHDAVAEADHYGMPRPPASEFIIFPGDPATDEHLTGPNRRRVRHRPNA